MQYSELDFIKGIKEDDDKILKSLYHKYFRMIRHFVITNSGHESDAKDLYHETLMALISIVKKENFILTSSLSTLIFSIAKNLWFKHLNKNKNISSSGDVYSDVFEGGESIVDVYMEEYQQENENICKMQVALQLLGDTCYQLLKEFYYHRLSMEMIARKLGYNNADVAKNQKYKCLQRLKKLFFENKHKLYSKTLDYETDNDRLV